MSLAKTIKNWWKGSSDGANEEAGPASPPNRGMSTPPGSPPKQPGEAATSGRLRNRVSFSAASNNPPTPDIKTKEYSDLIHQYENDFLVAADKLAPKTKIGNKNQQHLLMMTNDINLINAFIEYKSNSENQKDSNYKKFNYQSLQDVLAAPSIEPLKKEGNYSWDIAKILNLFNWDPTRRNRTNYYDEMKAMVKNEKNNTVSDVLEKIARIKDAVVMDATSGEPAAGTSSVNVGNLALGRNNPAHAAPPVVLVGSLQSSADPQPSSLSGGFPHSEIRRSPFDHPNDASSSQIRHDAPFKGGSNPGNIPDSDSNLGRSASLESALFTEHSGGSLPDMDKTVAHWNLGESSRSAPAGDASISRGSNRGGLGREPSSDNVASAPRSFAAELADSAARFDAAQQKWTAAAAATAAAADDQLVADAPRA
ncbi:MAG: hypothetical protein GZ090_09415, partial [Oxalobacteraceae bacterium]|nr:hypothetical protein [Oxalobacteraceae bacterium]